MVIFSGFFVFKVLPALVALAYTSYLTYIMSNPALLKTKRAKLAKLVTKDSPAYGMYQGLYSTKSLLGWTFVSSALALGLALDYYRAAPDYSPTVLVFMQVIQLALFGTGLYLWFASSRNK